MKNCTEAGIHTPVGAFSTPLANWRTSLNNFSEANIKFSINYFTVMIFAIGTRPSRR